MVTTREMQKREMEMREEVYTPPDQLYMPKQLVEKYEGQGYKLRYLRVQDADGKPDMKNISRRLQEGFEFVKASEEPELALLANTGSFHKFQDIIMTGDLALAKIRTTKAKARQKYYEDQARLAYQAARQQARGDRPDLDDKYPVFDTSQSKVGFGRKPKFADEDRE